MESSNRYVYILLLKVPSCLFVDVAMEDGLSAGLLIGVLTSIVMLVFGGIFILYKWIQKCGQRPGGGRFGPRGMALQQRNERQQQEAYQMQQVQQQGLHQAAQPAPHAGQAGFPTPQPYPQSQAQQQVHTAPQPAGFSPVVSQTPGSYPAQQAGYPVQQAGYPVGHTTTPAYPHPQPQPYPHPQAPPYPTQQQ